MPQTETVPLHDTPSLTEAAVSRRALLTAGAGVAGAAAIASSTAQAQAPVAAPQMPPVQAPVRQEWLAKRTEQILEPGLPIVDPHHHLWDAPRYRYMFPELLAEKAREARARDEHQRAVLARSRGMMDVAA